MRQIIWLWSQEMSTVSDAEKPPKVPKSSAPCCSPQSSIENPRKIEQKKVALLCLNRSPPPAAPPAPSLHPSIRHLHCLASLL